ncbi:olfactory receptor 1361-like [Tachyglossus aculeatus]|uniref:olfactory receptor 1361-like n=1 Tax=Tachyglossus aculeatus TaxID=9261 RepID=UPI0018F7C763|nr:olfactory receptor 1361-like [Tachyglossus aculeatus]
MINQSSASEFVLLGLFTDPGQQPLLSFIFLVLYLVTVGGNLLIILAIGADSHLHSPMYFFLTHLSLVDVCCSSTIVPKMLADMQTGSHTISYIGYLDDFLLAVVAFDGFMAICRSLCSATAVNPWRCILPVATCWVISQLNSLLHTILLAQLTCCDDLTIPHFSCDLALPRSFSDTSFNELVLLSAVISEYMGPSPPGSSDENSLATVRYMVITLLLNAFIHSQCNHDLHRALGLTSQFLTFAGTSGPSEGKLGGSEYGFP